jgi:FAD:protein FMN transferase
MNCYSGLCLLVIIVVLAGCNKSTGSQQPTKCGKPVASANPKPASGEIRVVERTVSAMKTLFTISVTSATDNEKAHRAVKAAFDEIRRVENLMTTFKADSPLSQVNANAGIAPVAVPGELVEIVEEANRISKLTDGKFNIAVETLGALWHFRAKTPRAPDPFEVARRLPLLDTKSIITDKPHNTIYLAKPGMRIGLGAIAKGYAVDRAGKVLLEHNIKDFIVNGGGDILFSGKKGANFWNVGIRDPRENSRYFARFDVLKDSSVSTSGDYEKFFFDRGKRYHHLIDPSTGYPAQGTVSATVIAKTACLSDALATAIFVLGVDKGMKLIEADPNLEAIIVDDKLQIHISSRLKRRVQLSVIANR